MGAFLFYCIRKLLFLFSRKNRRYSEKDKASEALF